MPTKISKIFKRLKQDFKIIKIAKNWREILSAKINGQFVKSIRLRNGVVLNAPGKIDLNFVFHEIWIDEIYLPKGYEINTKDVVFDIGANIGVFSLYASSKARDVKVYSFEPFPSNADYFEKNFRESDVNNIYFFRGAVASKSEKRKLNVSESWIKHVLNEKNEENEMYIDVECISLDEAFCKIEKCDLLKIDCEGSEYEILYSAKPETINKINKIVGEFHNRDSTDMTGKALRTFLEKNGLQISNYYNFDKESGFFAAKRKNHNLTK
ncbi:MAG: FkbM family methyltransferase [Chitinophagaceae bacterium]